MTLRCRSCELHGEVVGIGGGGLNGEAVRNGIGTGVVRGLGVSGWEGRGGLELLWFGYGNGRMRGRTWVVWDHRIKGLIVRG